MKSLVLTITLLGVCTAAFGDNAISNSDPSGDSVSETALPDLPPQPAATLDLPPAPDWLSIFLPPTPPAPQAVDAHALIRAAARKHRVPAAFVTSIVAAESNFDPLALSPKGAIGLMQVMPSTAQLFGLDAAVPEQNVDAGTHYLRVLIDRYRKYKNWMTRVIAAYNAGPGVVDRYHGVPPYPETRTYVARVLAYMRKFQRQNV